MQSVGIRALKANLSRELKRVRTGKRLLVTERGRAVAVLSPVDEAPDLAWAHQLVAEGLASWSGGKPKGAARPVRLKGHKTASDAVLEDRE